MCTLQRGALNNQSLRYTVPANAGARRHVIDRVDEHRNRALSYVHVGLKGSRLSLIANFEGVKAPINPLHDRLNMDALRRVQQ